MKIRSDFKMRHFQQYR